MPLLRLAAAAWLCAGAAPALAAPASPPEPLALLAPIQSVTPIPAAPQPTAAALLPAAPAVEVYYEQRGNAPIWLRDAATTQAAKLLAAILRRARLDGLADAPELARMVEAAIARAQGFAPGSKPAGSLAEDKLLSAAWVQYVRALRAPIPGMTYGDPGLAPQLPRPERILFDAQRAPSLARHVASVAAVNPVYARLRDAAWARLHRDPRLQLEPQLQLVSGPALDPRLLEDLHRARILPATGRYVVVNLATARLWTYEDGRVVDTMKVVVGKRDTPTPMLAGTIHYATFNPYWNIPPDVVRDVVAPLVLKRGVSYLSAARYEVASDWSDMASVVPPAEVDWKAVAAGTAQVRIRQLPGVDNMMGAIKFGFANDLGIYLHDTPHKDLFARARRNFSLGCVRVEDARRLARWLLGREPVAPSAEPEQHVKLAAAVPVYLIALNPPATAAELATADQGYGPDPLADAPLADELRASGAAAGTSSPR